MRTYLKYVLKHVFLHFRVVYPYRTATNLDTIQNDVVVLSADPTVVARIERRQVLVHRSSKWVMGATPSSSASQEFLVLIVTREQWELCNPEEMRRGWKHKFTYG